MAGGLAVAGQSGNVVTVARVLTAAMAESLARQESLARLRAQVLRETILYAVRRTEDSEAGWLVCDLYLIDGAEVACLTTDIAHALDCFDPAREVGVKFRRGPMADPLTQALDLRLSTLLFGEPDLLRHRMLG